MSVWAEARQQADRRHAKYAGSGDALVSAEMLFRAAELETGLTREVRPQGDALLEGAEAMYDAERRRIYTSSATNLQVAAFHIAHEFAHHWLDQAGKRCGGTDLNIATPAEPEMSWVGDPDAYSPKERAEALANVYAREFLLPRSKLRALTALESFDAHAISILVGVPVDLVMQQLADALLLPVERMGSDAVSAEKPPDDTQSRAITAGNGPSRVLAGPGTGKTRTLIGRVVHLIAQGSNSGSIAVLTFSNLSAQDISARLRAAVGEKATALWVGTFHAFGLELLRKYGAAIGLPASLRLLNRSDTLDLLLELLPRLNLNYYLDLNEPLRKLGSIASLISRAKDELVTPQAYELAARAQQEAATDKSSREEADRALEAARAYVVYEAELRRRGWVDFGDLIAQTVELLRTTDCRPQVRSQYRHLLVDEYQDMNRASAMLLRELVEPGAGPWVVGDVRQAIYRFRGASPINLENFDRDFPGASTKLLGVNYRSGGRIVRTFESFGGGPPLEPHRGRDEGSISFHVATTLRAEYEGIASSILAAIAQGGHFVDHAILARSHTTLARLSQYLEMRGVPCLYFGDFFERPEIRDLLSLLQLTSEPTGVGLVRVARLPQYVLSDSDIAALFEVREARDKPMLAVLRDPRGIVGLSAVGYATVQRLASDLSSVEYSQTAHALLLRFLLGRGDHLGPLLADRSVAGQQRRLAVYQLLQVARTFRAPPKTDPKRAFLDHIRRLELLDEEKQLRQLPAAAQDIDAVRLMTVHASKGLQFPIVHLPTLTNRHFPFNRKDLTVLPLGLADTSALMSREAEEEALFFVALSRAENEVHLSRAINCGGGGYQNCAPSPFLARIRQHLPRPPDAAADWNREGRGEPEANLLPGLAHRASWSAHAIETYLECPRKFYYREVLNLHPQGSQSPFLRSHAAVKASLEWMRDAASQEARAAWPERFSADWLEKGPQGHALESLYRTAAEQMMRTAQTLMDGEIRPLDLELTVGGGIKVTAHADHIRLHNGEMVIQRLKEGRLAKKETVKIRYAIWQAAAMRQQGNGVKVRFEHVSLLTGERSEATAKDKGLNADIAKVETALVNIAAGRFAPAPNQYCPQCEFYFICPAHFRIERAGG